MAKPKKQTKKTGATEAAKPATGGKVAIDRSTKTTIVGIVVALVVVGWLIIGPSPDDETIPVIIPTLSADATKGKQVYNKVCKECHGENVGGSKKGPPLIHPYYRPGHHGDGSFRSALALGVRQHHWKFGQMPPQPRVKADQIQPLIAYIREMQRANGIN